MQVARDDKKSRPRQAGMLSISRSTAAGTGACLSKPALLRVETRIAARRSVCMLAFGALFYLDRIVSPAPDEVTSTTVTGASGQHGGAAFTTTHWSVVLEAQGESPAAQEALEKLCRTYWRPIFAFLRRQGLSSAEAEDITQGFFAQLLERRSLDAVRKKKGRLRSYLLGALKYFLTDEQRRAMAIKRGKGQRVMSFDELRAEEQIEMELADPVTPGNDLRTPMGFDRSRERAQPIEG
jgi:DNA-directed RNA polymerase specialized sigma24 family protein